MKAIATPSTIRWTSGRTTSATPSECRRPSSKTPLASYLVWHKVDTLVVTGGSASGCVRATAAYHARPGQQ
jgi:nicotinamidase-related amidase